MISHEVKITREMQTILGEFALTTEGAKVTEGDVLRCYHGMWYIGFYIVFSSDDLIEYYWDDKFTGWLKKHYPEALI